MPKILVCAATRTETEGARLGIRKAGLEGRFEILRTGIGPISATRAIEKYLDSMEPRERPERIISTGFAGSWNPELEVGQWIEASSVSDEDGNTIGLSAGISGFAREAPLRSVAVIQAPPPGLPTAPVPLAVDMESFALARAARGHGIPFSAFRYITDSTEAPLPDFVRHFTRAIAPPSNEPMLGRARSTAEGAWALLRSPSGVAAIVRDGKRWRDDLVAGWTRFAEKLY